MKHNEHLFVDWGGYVAITHQASMHVWETPFPIFFSVLRKRRNSAKRRDQPPQPTAMSEEKPKQEQQQQQQQKKERKEKKEKKEKPAKKEGGTSPAAGGATAQQKDTSQLLGIEAKKAVSFSDWYTQVITRSDMLDYYDVSGCYILRPWAFRQWELIQAFFDGEIRRSGVQNAYFPMFVSSSALKREEDAFEGFSAEVAWVTKSGKSDLAEPIAVRPTSETVMYPAYSVSFFPLPHERREKESDVIFSFCLRTDNARGAKPRNHRTGSRATATCL